MVIENNRYQIDLVISMVCILIITFGLLFKNFQFDNYLVSFINNSLGNICGVIASSFLFIWWSKEVQFKRREIVILAVGFGLIIYEFFQILLPWQTFDWNDNLGTLIGVVIASIINLVILSVKRILINQKNRKMI